MRIKAIKVYQSVTFNKASETYFTIIPIANKPKLTIAHIPEMMSMEIKAIKENGDILDHVLVPFTNIAGIYMWTASDDKHLEFIEQEKNVKITQSFPKKAR